MKIRTTLKVLAGAAVVLAAVSPAHAGQVILSPEPVSELYTGNSAGWNFVVSPDRHRINYSVHDERYVRPTNLLVMTGSGVFAYDVASDGTVKINSDRQLIRNGGEVEFTPLHAAAFEFSGAVRNVSWTRSLASQVLVAIKGNYLVAKFAPPTDKETAKKLARFGARRLTVTTDAGTYTFTLSSGPGGAPVYKVVGDGRAN